MRENTMLHFQGEVDTAKLAEAMETLRTTYEEFRTEGIGRIEFPFAHRLFRNRASEMTEGPHALVNLIVEASLSGRPLGDGLAYVKRASDLSHASTNDVIKRDFPPFADMVKIIVTPDRDAVEADCIIEDFSEAGVCR